MQNLTTIQPLPRMRTIKEAAQEIKEQDEHTALTQWRIRELVLSGVLPSVRAGNKILLNLDTLFEYLSNPNAEKFKPESDSAAPGIRRVL